MKIYLATETDPYFNLATEQYLLDTEEDEIFMLWQNDRSIIIGRNQNAYAEINRPFVEQHAIPVVRRLTGGGAVFHDLGNLNYTFISSRTVCPELDFARFSRPILEALHEKKVPAVLSGRNDILVDGKKISGNAQCVYNDKIMHHGTLLFSSDLSSLADALCVDAEKMHSKGIKSVRSRVENLAHYLPDMTVSDFRDYLFARAVGERASFSSTQLSEIRVLRNEKYATWEWNFGVSKQYGKQLKKRYPYGSVELSYDSEQGILTNVSLHGDFFGSAPVEHLEETLVGCRLERPALIARLTSVSQYIAGAAPDDIVALFLA